MSGEAQQTTAQSSGGRRITNAAAFEYGSLGKQVLFTIVTLGFYTIWWTHKLHVQLNEGTDADFSPLMRTIGMFIPIYNLVVLWRTSHDASVLADQDGPIVFLLFLVVAPVSWYLIQSGINDIAQGGGSAAGAHGG